MPKLPSTTKCHYYDHQTIKCEGPVAFTAHDQRGCRDVCFAHVQWITTLSFITGHSLNCPKNGAD